MARLSLVTVACNTTVNPYYSYLTKVLCLKLKDLIISIALLWTLRMRSLYKHYQLLSQWPISNFYLKAFSSLLTLYSNLYKHKEYQLAARIQLGEVNEGRGDGSRL